MAVVEQAARTERPREVKVRTPARLSKRRRRPDRVSRKFRNLALFQVHVTMERRTGEAAPICPDEMVFRWP